MNMTSNDSLVSNRQVVALHVINDSVDTGVKNEGLLDTKLQDIGCCGDVPKVLKPNNKKRDKLLEWLKSSQLKREENNRQVFSRWIDMVDNGAIDLMSLSNYPGKSSKPVNNFCSINSTVANSVQGSPETTMSQVDAMANITPQMSKQALVANQVKPVIPSTNMCPQYFPPINNPNYYGMAQNWFSGNQPPLYSPMQIPQQMPLGIYPGFGSYCSSNPMLGNYYQYVPIQQACTLCPSYVVPSLSSGLETSYSVTPSIQMQSISQSDNSSVNIDVHKWFDVLNEIKINPSLADTVEDSSFQSDLKEANNIKDKIIN